MRVEVYYNLHRSCWSVRALEGEQRGRVIAHATCVQLCGVTFVVQPAGNAKVRREGRKTVHAFARGWLVGYEAREETRGRCTQRVTYNPYKDTSFVLADQGDERPPVSQAWVVVMTESRAVIGEGVS